jgi:virulence-associated protein VapD
MAYPPKIDPIQKTWVIAVDFKLDKLKKYCLEKQEKDDKECQKELSNYRAKIFNTFYDIVKQYGFEWRMQNSLVFNNSTDATKAFKAISLGVKKSWVKYFIEKIHLFEIDPNSNASDLLELDTDVDRPDWFTEELKNFLLIDEENNTDEWF